MNRITRSCLSGHQWEVAADSVTASDACPICGAGVETLVAPTLDPALLSKSGAAASPVALQVPGYEIECELGRGAMGVVYRARQRSLGRTVALKVLAAGPLASPELLSRFRTEAEAVAKLAHPHIVQIYEVGDAGGNAYFSLEYIDGGTLSDRSRQGPLPPRAAAQIVSTLARAVHYAHRRGVVHRDLKPSNVLVAADGTPKVADFGLAKHLAGDSHQTRTGDVMGSPSYMAPEQARGATQQIGPASDTYALGAILYELLTGRPPFVGQDLMETLLLVMDADPVPPRRLLPKIPRDVETICLKCLDKSPRGRYATAEALAEDLDRFLDSRPILARPAGPVELALKWARRRPAAAALVAVSVLSAATIITYGAWKNGQLRESLSNEQTARVRAQDNFRKAMAAADRRLTRAGQDPHKLFQEELEFYHEIRAQPGDDPAVRYERGMAARRAGDVRRLLGENPAAERDYREAIELLSALAAEAPEVEDYRRDLASAHNGLGQLKESAGQYDDADGEYRAAIDLLARLADENPSDLDYRQQLGRLWNNVAIQFSRQNNLGDAEAAHERALAIRRKLVADADAGDSATFRMDESVSLANLAALYSKLGKPDKSLAALTEALRLREGLPESLRAEVDVRESTASAYNNLGVLQSSAGKAKEAIDAHQRALAGFEALANDYPQAPKYRALWADSHANLAFHFASNGRFEEAVREFAAALAIWEALAATDPKNAAYGEQAERARGFLNEAKASLESTQTPRP